MAKKNLLPTFASLFLSIGLLASEQAFSLEYKLKTNLSASDKTAVQNLLDRAESMLPAKLKQAVGTVDVSVEKIEINIPGREKVEPAGMASRFGNNIKININYLNDIVVGPARSRQTPQRQHKNAYDEALATVLHETVHVYDKLNLHTPEETSWIARCRKDEFTKSQLGRTFPDECAAYRNISQTFSQNPYFLQVAGWVGLDFNGMSHRSPDQYEATNPQEAFAVNMEYFLMDPNFKCRRPSMYRLLASHFQHEPFAGVSCNNELGYVLPSTSPTEKAQFLKIDPSRVYQVHYLLADKGEAMMSGWGHAMIRLVICNDNRPKVGPECLLDVDKSVVLSYRAFIDSMNISSWDGLRGKYPSRLFIIPLKQVTDEYAMGELRALESIPLKMSRKEIENFVVRSVEAHWAYDGKYYFISNNCATETLNLLKGSLLDPKLMFADIRDLDPSPRRDNINPIGLKQTLVGLDLADASVLKNRPEAMRLGFYFDSFEARFNKTFKVVQELGISAPTFKDYLNYTAAQRRDVIAKIDRANPRFIYHAAALTMLENASARKLETMLKAKIQKVVVEELNSAKAAGKGTKAGSIAKDFMAISQLFATPSNFLVGQDGYGLPMDQEIVNAKQNIDTQGQRSVKIAADAKNLADSLVSPADAREIELTASNMETLKAIIRPAASKLRGLVK